MAGRGKANSIDVGVGNRLQLRRISIGMSQEMLGKHLGLTFQQIQKFENGTNRISAGYLFEIAKALQVSISYFFAKADWRDPMADLPVKTQRFLTSSEGTQLWRSFVRIKDAGKRRRVLDLAKAIARRS